MSPAGLSGHPPNGFPGISYTLLHGDDFFFSTLRRPQKDFNQKEAKVFFL